MSAKDRRDDPMYGKILPLTTVLIVDDRSLLAPYGKQEEPPTVEDSKTQK